MTHRDVELLAIGAGPSNLALAVALEELAPDDLARDCLLIERSDSVAWQQGLLPPWAKSQISFLKDLVTRRNPRSKFSFVNYLHTSGQLIEFINMGHLQPYRMEVSAYLTWVANSLAKVGLEVGRECVSIEPSRDEAHTLVGWTTRLADGSTIFSRYLVLAAGRDPYTPPVFADLPESRVVHSTGYSARIAAMAGAHPRRVAVVGGAQSAAEMFRALCEDLPDTEIVWVARSSLSELQLSKFTNEMYYPSFVDTVYEAPPEGREQIMREMFSTNYSGVEPELLDTLYADRYVDKLSKRNRTGMITMVDVVGVHETASAEADTGGDGRADRHVDIHGDQRLVLDLSDRRTGKVSQLACDMVFLGTGFVREMPTLVQGLAAELKLDQVTVNRQYRLMLNEPSPAVCYLHGVNEATHGIADSLLSVLADRAADTVRDLLTHRATEEVRPAEELVLSRTPKVGVPTPDHR